MAKSKELTVKCVVACKNTMGDPDFYFVKVNCNADEHDKDKHYNAAIKKAKEIGFSKIGPVYDHFDHAGKALMELFEWDSADIVSVK